MEENDKVEDNDKDDNNFKDISALGLDRDLGFSRGYQGHQGHKPPDDDEEDDNDKVEDNDKDDNNDKSIETWDFREDIKDIKGIVVKKKFIKNIFFGKKSEKKLL